MPRLVPAAAAGPAGASCGVSARSCRRAGTCLAWVPRKAFYEVSVPAAWSQPLSGSCKGPGPSLPNLRPCWPLRTFWSRLVRGAALHCTGQPFLLKGDLPQHLQSRGRRRRGGREVPAETRAGRKACSVQAGHPLPASRCRAAVRTPLEATPRPRQTGCAAHKPPHPLVSQKRNRLGRLPPDAWVPGSAHLPRGCWEGVPGWPRPRGE